MELENYYETARVADFIHTNNFKRVALQFPDELLRDSSKVLRALREKLPAAVKLYVMADTTYGSCCVDEVGAAHVNADCVIHYGHTCLSPTTTIPAFCVFGKAPIKASNCAEKIVNQAVKSGKPVLVLFGLEYAHAIPDIKEALNVQVSGLDDSKSGPKVIYAYATSSIITPLVTGKQTNELQGSSGKQDISEDQRIGGLSWSLPEGHRVEDYLFFWIGSDNSAFTNVILTCNSSEIVRYDANEDSLMTDISQQSKILKRRYYLVEKAKDANMVGILVGTLGVAGYLDMIHQMTDLVTRAEKKAYTLVMGRPNPAKLANFPECDVFIYVSCAQTALLDSKDFLAPIITPFEAMLAFNRGSQWTGAYHMEFQNLIASSSVEIVQEPEARFSFLKGGYVEDYNLLEAEDETDAVLSLVSVTEKALRLQNKDTQLSKGKNARSGAEFFAGRSFQGLEINGNDSSPQPFSVGRTGRASRYKGEE